ncbi:MAG: hypothetical protein H0X31_13530 [Nostocaceae cyanobacterium]|nr:hypothetical protein [Nostocaceae cyanobacterium]
MIISYNLSRIKHDYQDLWLTVFNPFPSSLPGTNDRRSGLQREIAFYQTRVSQDPQSGMNPADEGESLLEDGEGYWRK